MWYVNIEEVFYQWEMMGVFTIILPFLLIFAIVYGILRSTKFLGDNSGVHVLVSLVVGLISLRWRNFLSDYLTELFPRLGIGLAVILALMILVGMFITKKDARYWGWGLGALAGFIALIVLYQSFDRLGWITSGGPADSIAGLIFLGILLIGVIIAVAVGSKGRSQGDTAHAVFPGKFLHYEE